MAGTSDSPHRYRPSFPTTPPTPLSRTALPRWLRQSHSRTAHLPGGKLRLLLVATVCMALGWILTTALGPGEQDTFLGESAYDTASGGILDDPTGFGDLASVSHVQEGIIGESELEDGSADDADTTQDKKVSVAGALADLHDAVKDKIQGWTPYTSRPRPNVSHQSAHKTSPAGHPATNVTASAGEEVKDGIGETERLGARVRIGKCTILFNGNSFWERAIRTHEQHDRQHGYRLHVLRQHLMDDVWSKPAYILSLLLRELAKPESDRLEWLFWVDADTVILNPYVPIDVFLPPPGSEFDDIHLMYSNDWNGLNNGVFPVRVNQWSVQLFSAITSFRHYRPDADLIFRDQSAMDMLMNEPAFRDNIVQAPQRWFNAYQGEHNETLAPFQIRRGDFLVHFAGVPDREDRMGFWLDRAEQHLDDWEISVKSTSYPQEVRDFWDEQRGVRRARKEALAAARLKVKEMVAKADQDLADYGDRIGEVQRATIQSLRDELNRMLESDASSSTAAIMETRLDSLAQAMEPLTAVLAQAHRSLLTFAHEAIFAAEKDFLGLQGASGGADPEVDAMAQAVQELKLLLMMPEEQWDRHEIAAATNALTETRSRLHGLVPAGVGVSAGSDESLPPTETAAMPGGGEIATVTAEPVALPLATLEAQVQPDPEAAAVVAAPAVVQE